MGKIPFDCWQSVWVSAPDPPAYPRGTTEAIEVADRHWQLVMGIDLHNWGDRYFGCSATRWLIYRTIAEEFGWKPAGTTAPLGTQAHWDGGYGDTAGRQVSAADALALGLALKRA